MTKTELLKQCAQWVKEDDWWDICDYLFELGFNCQQVAKYVVDADDDGYEQSIVYRVESLPGGNDFIFFHFAISYGNAGWEGMGVNLLEVEPYITTRYKYIKNWSDDD
jgi:hypothetical protein